MAATLRINQEHSGIELIGQSRKIHVILQSEIHKLAHAAAAYRQGQQNGDYRMGIEALAIFQGHTGAKKSSLHGMHKIKVRSIYGSAGFFKTQS